MIYPSNTCNSCICLGKIVSTGFNFFCKDYNLIVKIQIIVLKSYFCLQNILVSMAANRLVEIAYLRAVAIFLVVLMHAFSPYMGWKFVQTDYESTYNSIFSIWMGGRMPVFLFISGFLFSYLLHVKHKYGHYGLFLWNKVKRLLIPYLVFVVLMVLSHNRLDFSNPESAFSLLWLFIKKGYWHLWFLLTLFLCFFITKPLSLIKYPWVHVLVLVVSSVISIFFKTTILFGVNFLVYYFVYFYWGYVVERYKKQVILFFRWEVALSLLLVWFVLCFIRDYVGVNGVALHVFRYFSNISFIFGVYVVVHLLVKEGRIKEYPIIERINKYSYGIYIFHVWIITLLFLKERFFTDWLYSKATEYPVLSPVLIFVFVAFCSVLLTHLLLKTRIGRFLIA